VNFSGITLWISDTTINLTLAGELHGHDVVTLLKMIFGAIIGGLPDELILDLDETTFLGDDGHWVLVAGYAVAIQYGTRFRVVNARGQVRHRLQATETLDALADSDDLGALVAAVLIGPTPNLA
jgi:anti-anti-sigma regulatory factor